MKINIITPKISEKHNDSFWYEGHIANAFNKEGREFVLIACGHIEIRDKEGYVVHDGSKERNDGIKGGLNDDDDLKKIGCNYDDPYYWENNN